MRPESAAMRLRLLLATFLVAFSAAAFAADTAKKEKAAPRKAEGTPWAALTVEQQQVLAPLRPHWDELDAARKKKWIGVAGRYPSMSPTEQQRVQRRMETWAKLSPDDRRKARETYLDLSRLPPEKKQDLREKWAEYQSLTPAERSQLQPAPGDAKAAERKRRAKPAPAPQPPSPQTFPQP